VRRVAVPEDLEADAVFERHYEGEKVRMGERGEGRGGRTVLVPGVGLEVGEESGVGRENLL
jgi:hypothetical protein